MSKTENLKRSANFLTSALDLIMDAMTGDENGGLKHARGKISASLKILDKIAERESKTLTIWDFVEQHCNILVEESVVVEEVYNRYKMWCFENGISLKCQTMFHRDLSAIPGIRRVHYGERAGKRFVTHSDPGFTKLHGIGLKRHLRSVDG